MGTVLLVPRADYTTPPLQLARLGEAVKAIRKQRNLKQIEVATGAGLTESQISDIENARNNPGWLLITQLVEDGLGVGLPELIAAYEAAEGNTRGADDPAR